MNGMTEIKTAHGVAITTTRHVSLADLYAWTRLGEKAIAKMEGK